MGFLSLLQTNVMREKRYGINASNGVLKHQAVLPFPIFRSVFLQRPEVRVPAIHHDGLFDLLSSVVLQLRNSLAGSLDL